MTNPLSLKQAVDWIDQGGTVHLNNNLLFKDSFCQRLSSCSAKKQNEELKKLIAFIKERCLQNRVDQSTVELGNILIKTYGQNPKLNAKLQKLDHYLAPRRVSLGFDETYLFETTRLLEKDWMENCYEKNLFLNHPDFIQFLYKSKLYKQILISKDALKEIDGHPHILANGHWLPFSKLKNDFAIIKENNIYERHLISKSDKKIYTYLYRGYGLEEFNPYKEGLYKPISQISNEEYTKTLDLAKQFERQNDMALTDSRNFILQIVTSTIETDTDHAVLGNYKKVFIKAKHPYIRLINPQGEVFEVGFGLFGTNQKGALSTEKGVFRSLDVWEYKRVKERIVTNIAVSEEEFEKARSYTHKYQNQGNGASFNFLYQNCAVFAKNIVKSITNIDIKIEMRLTKVIQAIMPRFIKNMSQNFSKAKKVAKIILKTIVPSCLIKITSYLFKIVEKIIASTAAFFITTFIILFLGGRKGDKGLQFNPQGKIKNKAPPLKGLKNWFDLKLYTINTVSLMQNWQKKQKTTVIYKNPKKLCVVP